MEYNLMDLKEEARRKVEAYADLILETHKENVISICLYGSVLTEEYIEKKSNINVIVFLKKIDPPDLMKTKSIVKKFNKKNIISLFMTEEHLETSTDVFPIEFLEMKENHRTVFGKDIFRDLVISNKNVRFQCEQLLKGNLIRLYQIYLELGETPKKLVNIAVNHLSSFFPVFRNLLRMTGSKPPVTKREIIIDLCNKFNLDGSIWLNILKIKEGKMKTEEIEKLFLDFIEEIEKLGLIIDKLEV